MKKTANHLSSVHYMDVLNTTSLGRLTGGTANANANEEGWELIYIDGKPVWVKKNSAGQIIEILAA